MIQFSKSNEEKMGRRGRHRESTERKEENHRQRELEPEEGTVGRMGDSEVQRGDALRKAEAEGRDGQVSSGCSFSNFHGVPPKASVPPAKSSRPSSSQLSPA